MNVHLWGACRLYQHGMGTRMQWSSVTQWKSCHASGCMLATAIVRRCDRPPYAVVYHFRWVSRRQTAGHRLSIAFLVSVSLDVRGRRILDCVYTVAFDGIRLADWDPSQSLGVCWSTYKH
jgi:hypothetical protein